MTAATRDTLLDAIAMLRAANTGDSEARDSIVDHADTRALAVSLARLAHTYLAGAAQMSGVPPEEIPAAINHLLDAALDRELLDAELDTADILGGNAPQP